MFYLSLLFFAWVSWTAPWWASWPVAFVLGLLWPGGKRRALLVVSAALVATNAVAYFWDERSFGIIAKRMSGLFGLPFAGGIFLVLSLLTGVTVWLGYRSGAASAMVLREMRSMRKHR